MGKSVYDNFQEVTTMADTQALSGVMLLLLRDKPVRAEMQAFGTLRNTFFTGTNNQLRKHVCPPTELESVPLVGVGPIDPLPPNRTFDLRLLRAFDLPLPPNVAAMLGAIVLPMWIIEDSTPPRRQSFPSPLLRMVRGEIIHAVVGTSSGVHNIHWHGIEPTPMNDGVGKHSFEINNSFVYQFQPNQAGTFFYHCHKNTVHHFEMGLYGGLIVDPPAPAGSGLTAPYVTGGPGFVAGRLTTSPAGTEVLAYDIEKIWVVDDMDSAWHLSGSDHMLNMQACNPLDPNAPGTFYVFGTNPINLNDFQPDIFTVTGVVLDVGARNGQGVFQGVIDNAAIRIDANVGQRVLLRYLNTGYTIQELTLPVDATVIAWDGHPLGVGGFHRFSSPYVVPAGRPIQTTTARRMDIMLNTDAAVSLLAHIRYYDWIKGVPNGLVGHVQIPVNINA